MTNAGDHERIENEGKLLGDLELQSSEFSARESGNEPNAIKNVDLTDIGNALRFVQQHKQIIRYCPELKRWLVFKLGTVCSK